jgi:hypothetical protein
MDAATLEKTIIDIFSLKRKPAEELYRLSRDKLYKEHKRWRSISYQHVDNIESNPTATVSPVVLACATLVGTHFDISATKSLIVDRSARLTGRSGSLFEIANCFSLNGQTFIAASRIAETSVILLVMGNLPFVRAVYLPTLSIGLLRAPGEKPRDEQIWCENVIADLDAWAITCPDLAQRMLEGPPREIALLVRNSHIGHHLWDELGGLEALHRAGALASVDCVHVWPPPVATELYRPVDQIFPELNGKVRRYKDTAAFESALAAGATIAPHGTRFISAALADRILDLCLMAVPVFCRTLDWISEDAEWKILIGLRVENRCWPDQADGYVAALAALAERFGNLAVVFDGHNSADNPAVGSIRSYHEPITDSTDEGGEMITVAEERRIVSRVKESLAASDLADKIRIIDTIRAPVAHSIAASAWCDFFITHWGAGLAKYKWIANKPGIVVTNRLMLESGKGKSRNLLIYDSPKCREGVIASSFVPAEIVNDHPGMGRQMVANSDPTSRCFDVDVAAFVGFVVDWVATRPAKNRATIEPEETGGA